MKILLPYEEMHKNHPLRLTRKRAHAILLSGQGILFKFPGKLNLCKINIITYQYVIFLYFAFRREFKQDTGQGYSVPMIGSIYDVCRQTVSTWFSKWQEKGTFRYGSRPGYFHEYGYTPTDL